MSKQLAELSRVMRNLFPESPGDRVEARITNTSRMVVKGRKQGIKYSATRYPNGTTFLTLVLRTQHK